MKRQYFVFYLYKGNLTCYGPLKNGDAAANSQHAICGYKKNSPVAGYYKFIRTYSGKNRAEAQKKFEDFLITQGYREVSEPYLNGKKFQQ